ncbi:Coq4-domain-containing protein [Testicularia cyperi]|uniref:4-hydroxy-3-methoxy-5-polyprenylbenzoate decarboxylase n=1 Tax=Testicularia cyperi TaxID=1882483 RepID=A0A317XER1_9BASI|nr:Coq4-domain-containing protein [Testicularia cyperi]
MAHLMPALRAVGPRSSRASTSMLQLQPVQMPRSKPIASSRSFASSTCNPSSSSSRRLDEIHHISTSITGKALLTAGSALGLLNNPSRGDLLSILTQVSSGPSLAHLLASMRSTESGRRLLVERPSINSETVNVGYLASLDRGKFGREWIEWLRDNGVGPDGRAEADYMPTGEEKYLIQRYRESHDFYHLLLRMPVTQLGETVVKYFEMAQMGMPVAGFAAAGGTLRMLGSALASLPRPSKLISAALSRPTSGSDTPAAPIDMSNRAAADLATLQELVPWAVEMGRTSVPLVSIEWERCWERDIDQMRHELGITPPPVTVAKFQGRKQRTGKRRGWPSKIIEAQRRKESAASAASAAAAAESVAAKP